MDHILQELNDIIDTLEVDLQSKNRLQEVASALKKMKMKADFKHNRIVKDKSIAINLLNASVEDMERHKEIIEKTNKKLVEQKQLIEHKNYVLEIQKKRIEEQTFVLENNLEKLSDSYQELEQFTYIASHDLKSPLRTITNFGQLLSRRIGKKLDDESKEFLDFMIKGARQMNTVICDLLEFAHVGNENKVKSEYDLEEVLSIVEFNLAEPIKQNDAQIICRQLPKMYGMKSSMIQLFQNLIGNAIKFRKEDVTPVVHIQVEKEGSQLIFEVRDNGVGMDEEYQEKAFMPFQRINNLDRPGSGIGLAICKKIVNQHGGEIYFKSIPGEGTCFCFTIDEQVYKAKRGENISLLKNEVIN